MREEQLLHMMDVLKNRAEMLMEFSARKEAGIQAFCSDIILEIIEYRKVLLENKELTQNEEN
jgi:hypothetical protein